MNIETHSEIFDSFTEASNNMREMVKQLVMKSDCFPFDDSCKYLPIVEYLDDISECIDENEAKIWKEIDTLITKTIMQPQYVHPDIQNLNFKDTDDANWYFAFVVNSDIVYIDYYEQGILSFNIHNMQNNKKTYYFEYTCQDDEGQIINKISVKLTNNIKP